MSKPTGPINTSKSKGGRPALPPEERVKFWGVYVDASLRPEADRLRAMLSANPGSQVTWSAVFATAIRESLKKRESR